MLFVNCSMVRIQHLWCEHSHNWYTMYGLGMTLYHFSRGAPGTKLPDANPPWLIGCLDPRTKMCLLWQLSTNGTWIVLNEGDSTPLCIIRANIQPHIDWLTSTKSNNSLSNSFSCSHSATVLSEGSNDNKTEKKASNIFVLSLVINWLCLEPDRWYSLSIDRSVPHGHTSNKEVPQGLLPSSYACGNPYTIPISLYTAVNYNYIMIASWVSWLVSRWEQKGGWHLQNVPWSPLTFPVIKCSISVG